MKKILITSMLIGAIAVPASANVFSFIRDFNKAFGITKKTDKTLGKIIEGAYYVSARQGVEDL